MHRRASFSLLELMIVLLLLAGVGTLVIGGATSLYQTARFHRQVYTLYEAAQELQLTALALQTDLQLLLFQQKGEWKARTVSPEKIVKPSEIDLSSVDRVFFNRRLEKSFLITFYSTGGIDLPDRTLERIGGPPLEQPVNQLICQRKEEQRGIDFSHLPTLHFWKDRPPASPPLAPLEFPLMPLTPLFNDSKSPSSSLETPATR